MKVNLEKLESLYEVINYRNAFTILKASNQNDFLELYETFNNFSISNSDITTPGGSESQIPKKFSNKLRNLGWRETRISGDLTVKLHSKKVGGKGGEERSIKLENFIDGHKIDYVKNRIAFDVEWNSKDQTFDRDLYAFGAFYQANIIDAAVIVTRSTKLQTYFNQLGEKVKRKYGASTTHLDKLIYRINSNRSNGCPVLALGITEKLIN